MSLSTHTALHLRQLYFGGNWTASDFRDVLSDVSSEEAVAKVGDCNTIATLFHHTSYYVAIQIRVLQGGPLEGKDEEGFAHPPIRSETDWKAMQDRVWKEIEQLADLIGQLPEERFWEPFTAQKYGDYFRTLHGMIEHAHYHLGQIVLLKKLLRTVK